MRGVIYFFSHGNACLHRYSPYVCLIISYNGTRAYKHGRKEDFSKGGGATFCLNCDLLRFMVSRKIVKSCNFEYVLIAFCNKKKSKIFN